MKNITFLIAIISLAIYSSCDTSDALECIRASSTEITEIRDHKDFKGVIFNHVGDLFLTQGNDYSVSITGPDNVIELTKTDIENEYLIIGTDNCFNGDYDIKVEITAPEYQLISLYGVGKIKTVNPIEGDLLEVEISGIGEVEAEIYIDSLYTLASGTATIRYEGEVINHQFASAGEFTLNAFPLLTSETSLNISGTGDSQVSASDQLNIIISGAGNVFYKGNPDIDSTILGVGEIIESN